MARTRIAPASPESTHDLLLLTHLHEVPLPVIESWSQRQLNQAERWAGLTHLGASDNPVKVPPMPDFLKPWEPPPGTLKQCLVTDPGHPTPPRFHVSGSCEPGLGIYIHDDDGESVLALWFPPSVRKRAVDEICVMLNDAAWTNDASSIAGLLTE